MTTKRIQRSRAKGWRMPPNTVYVGRGSKWGNPFRAFKDMVYIHAGHRRKFMDPWVVYFNYSVPEKTIQSFVVLLYAKLFERKKHWVDPDARHWADKFQDLDLKELKGKDLACWCKPGDPCHADVLLYLAELES